MQTRPALEFVSSARGHFRNERTVDWAALRRTACRAAGWLPHAAVEDAAQEAMLRAWRAWCNEGAPSSPEAWMTTIARREAMRWSSGPNGRSWSSTTADAAEPVAEAYDPVEQVDVQRALSELPPEDRALMTLRYQADLTQPEIARLTGMPEGTVKVRLHRARSRLREHLE
jgi:RNA polymerase sigma-70 factor (ECF subfamily)